MGGEEESAQRDTKENYQKEFTSVAIDDLKLNAACESTCSTGADSSLLLCRVCYCTEPDLQGDAALGYLGIVSPQHTHINNCHISDDCKDSNSIYIKDDVNPKNCTEALASIEIVNHQSDVNVCSADTENGSIQCDSTLICLGCSCKNDLALAHYACALKWFINRGSTICEICGNIAENVRLADLKKVLTSLKDYDDLRQRDTAGEISTLPDGANMDIDSDCLDETRRKRLTEVSSWFNHLNTPAISQGQIEQLYAVRGTNLVVNMSAADRANIGRTIESTGVFVAIGLFMVIIAWVLAPHFGKRGALAVFHLLLGGAASLAVVLFLRLIFPGAKLGQTRYWGISFIFWFLVLGVWSSRTYNVRRM